MLQAERHQYILEKLYRHKAVEVNELATELGVTPMTIRRDLQALEEGGRVKKSHGGAVLSESIAREATYGTANCPMWRKSGPLPRKR